MDYRFLDRLAGDDSHSRPAAEHQHCAFCGYDLFASVSDRCPECGNLIDTHAMRDQTDEARVQSLELEEAMRFLPLAWKLAAIGVTLFVIRVPPFLGPGAAWLARSLGFLCGFVALFLRLSVIRLGGQPGLTMTQEQLAARDSFLAAIEIVCGLFLMATAIGLK